ncbi:MAG: hypothetical protein IID15_05510 [Candidatus Marinimicrobia bacterium]|nr:hypothetical protein [Candidatus Neomarinimicrobiota bacterium]
MRQLSKSGSKSSLLLAVLLMAFSVTVVKANVRFFLQVMRNLQHYRLAGDQVAFDLQGAGTGHLTFNLTLPSRRNNFEEVLMAGYLSTAYAIDRTGLMVETVNVTALVTNDNNRMIATSAKALDMAKLVSNKLTPHEFLGLIERLN